jgi:RNA polymerase sigma-54 factor
MKIEISQQQKQIISPMLLQTLGLVILPAQELKEKLEEEAKVNPAIQLEKKKSEKQKNLSQRKSPSSFDSQAFLENLSASNFNLYNTMMEQVRESNFSQKEIKIAEIILSSVSEKGFLQQGNGKDSVKQIDLPELIANTGISLEEFEKVRQAVLRLDPIGIASYNIHEYLSLQAAQKFGTESIEAKLLKDYLTLLEKKLYTKIAKDIGVSYEKIEKAIANISHLNLTPVSSLPSGYPQYIVPDAFLNMNPEGIQLILNDEYIPEVKLNKHCLNLYQNQTFKGKKTVLAPDERSFLKENIEKAKILIENLKSRKEIIFKVILKIVEKQKDFFLKGPEYQIPLKLKDIADELNIHESTVSRVVKDKYIQTNKGIIHLKSFFSTNVGNDKTSSKSIKETLKNLFDAEDKDDPLSDDKAVEILKKKGLSISRRTIAKYRAELRIPPAFMRRNPK